jgi:hypothetical protein
VTTAGVTIAVEFYWPVQPIMGQHDYTAPLLAWKQTTISGLTSQPLVLSGYYSQTYCPMRHNISEEFLFEPQLEEGISSSLIQELNAADVQLIYFKTDSLFGGSPMVQLVGFDGNVRDLP